MGMAQTHNAPFPATLKLRVPAGLPSAVQAAARLQLMRPSEYLRRALFQQLRADGLDISPDGRVAPTQKDFV
jgi:hypothetical protein